MRRRTATQRTSTAFATIIAVMLGAGMLMLFWPGIALFDTVTQYQQILSGQYDDWHPPAMARLWSMFVAVGWRGSGPMLLLQLGLFWGGLALIGGAVAREGGARAGWAMLLVGLFPVVANWLPVIVKDMQLLAALTFATGLVAHYRLRRRAMPWWGVALVCLLLAYAVLVRANSAFVIVPLAWCWLGWAGARRLWVRGALMLAGLVLVFGLSGPINHKIFRASSSGVQKTLPIFDLAGIRHFAGHRILTGETADLLDEAEQRYCYTPFYWDPFANPTRCADLGDALSDDDLSPLVTRSWIGAIASHPIAYAAHRLSHLNLNLRFLVPADEQSSSAPALSDANNLGLGIGRTVPATWLWRLTKALERTPVGSPLLWLILSIGLGWVLLATPRQPARDMGLSLALSAICMTFSFAVVSIASDLRYHLWLIVATLLVLILTSQCRRVPAKRVAVTVIVLALVILIEAFARMHLPTIPI